MKKDLYHVVFKGWLCYLQFTTYTNSKDRTAISLHDVNDDSLVTVATVNLPDDLPDGHVFIKDWPENEGMVNAMENAGIVKWTGNTISTGYVYAHECRLLVDPV